MVDKWRSPEGGAVRLVNSTEITKFENFKDDFHKKGMDKGRIQFKIVCLLDKSLYGGDRLSQPINPTAS